MQLQVDLYTARVWQVSLSREIRVVYLVDRRAHNRVRTALLFSTDVEQDPKQIYQFYKLRFQIEFIFRDAKQFMGLRDCQARDLLKSDFTSMPVLLPSIWRSSMPIDSIRVRNRLCSP